MKRKGTLGSRCWLWAAFEAGCPLGGGTGSSSAQLLTGERCVCGGGGAVNPEPPGWQSTAAEFQKPPGQKRKMSYSSGRRLPRDT